MLLGNPVLVILRGQSLKRRGADCSGDSKRRDKNKIEAAPVRPNPDLEPLSPELEEFFVRRGISRATLDATGVMQERRFVKQLGRGR